jgi:hypothetical protein
MRNGQPAGFNTLFQELSGTGMGERCPLKPRL